MKRFLLGMAISIAAAAPASAQHVISCPGVTGSSVCDGVVFLGGYVNGGSVTGYGDDGLNYFTSASDFTFQSAFFQSQRGENNLVWVYGYTRADITAPATTFPLYTDPSLHTYEVSMRVTTGAPQEFVFNWPNMAAIGFTSWGGTVPNDLDAFEFDVSAIAITTTPEPASLALLATGLVGLVAFSRRKRVPC